ncbi:MAG: hypothetical protein KDD50_01250 [Bdellovibrionales bacterium]|nr:hypothetical protein [Bdellovibrionales bacterium]
MKIWYSKYTLNPVVSLNGLSEDLNFRAGFLIKVDFGSDVIGFSDVHPWEEFGDESIEDQLAILKKYKAGEAPLSKVLKRSLHFAQIDGQARKDRVSLIGDKVGEITNNYLVTELSSWSANQTLRVVRDGFKIMKVKMGSDLQGDTALLKAFVTLLKKGTSNTYIGYSSALKIRLDFNSLISSDDFIEWFGGVKEWLYPNLDYIEDPFPYDQEDWDRVSQKFQITFALDRENRDFQQPVSNRHVIVVKPAVENPYWIVEQLKRTSGKIAQPLDYDFVFTSYMDHPVGIASAVSEAIQFNAKFPGHLLSCGMLTHNLYQENNFSKEIEVKNGIVHFPGQNGIGFDDQLKNISWKEL